MPPEALAQIFPAAERVIYEKNTLEEVICQLKFPEILRIATDVPSDFQDAIRGDFPIYSEVDPVSNALPINTPPELARLLRANFGINPSAVTRRFVSADGIWTISLTSDFLALSTSRYSRWTDFRARLAPPLTALREIYSPAFFSRVGLRYRNTLRRSRLGLDSVPWGELLRPQIAAELLDATLPISEAKHQIVFELADDAKVRLLHGLQSHEGEPSYTIDTDFFQEQKTELANAEAVLTNFNREARRLFAWCITPRLHAAMEPRAIPDMDASVS